MAKITSLIIRTFHQTGNDIALPDEDIFWYEMNDFKQCIVGLHWTQDLTQSSSAKERIACQKNAYRTTGIDCQKWGDN